VQDYEEILTKKLIQIGLGRKSVLWAGNWPKDCKWRITINDNVTSLWKVSCRVSREFVLGLVSSHIFINYQEVELNCTGVKFTDSIKQGDVSSSWVREFIQTEQEQLETLIENKTIFWRVFVAFWSPKGNLGSSLETDSGELNFANVELKVQILNDRTKVKEKVDVKVGILPPPRKGQLVLLLTLKLLCKYGHFIVRCCPSSFTFLQSKFCRIKTAPYVEFEQCFGGYRWCVK